MERLRIIYDPKRPITAKAKPGDRRSKNTATVKVTTPPDDDPF